MANSQGIIPSEDAQVKAFKKSGGTSFLCKHVFPKVHLLESRGFNKWESYLTP